MTRKDFHEALKRGEPVAILAEEIARVENDFPNLKWVAGYTRKRYLEQAQELIDGLEKRGILVVEAL